MKPISTTISAGSSCNNACRFCEVASSGLPAKLPLTEERVVQTIAGTAWERASGTALEVVFTGGEASLDEHLAASIGAARRAGASTVTVRTNGRMLAYRGYAERLAQAGASHIEAALHGHRPEVHDWETRAEGSFKQCLRGLKRARKAGMTVGINTVVTRSNYRHLPEIAALIVRSGASFWKVHPLRSRGAALDSNTALHVPAPMQRPFLRRAQLVAERQGVSVTLVTKPHQDSPDDH